MHPALYFTAKVIGRVAPVWADKGDGTFSPASLNPLEQKDKSHGIQV
jgi:hypothetical protein